jgi:NADPH2:quinone reductase
MQWEELPDPEPVAGQIVIETEAVGVNFVDTMRRSGGHPSAPATPFTPGVELVGRVVAVGEHVTRFKTGDRVIGRCQTHGSYAERVSVEERFTVSCPESIPAADAAGLFVNPQTAYHALVTMGRAEPGDSVLVTAAAGGVGLCAVQLAKALGARVVAVAGSADKLALATQFGADCAISYRDADWPDQVRKATNGQGTNLILESVGGATTTGCVDCWAEGGRMVVFGKASGETGFIPGDQLLFGNRSVFGLAVGIVIEDEFLMRSAMDHIVDAYEAGQLKIHVGLTLPLNRAAEAHRQLESRDTAGKIVLIPG